VFNTEQLVNPSWEPLSVRGLGLGRRRGGGAAGPRKKRLPSVDAALALFAVTLLLVLYSSPAMIGLDLVVIVVITQVVLLALPAVLLAAAAVGLGSRRSRSAGLRGLRSSGRYWSASDWCPSSTCCRCYRARCGRARPRECRSR
jgi:hypothetical protein